MRLRRALRRSRLLQGEREFHLSLPGRIGHTAHGRRLERWAAVLAAAALDRLRRGLRDLGDFRAHMRLLVLGALLLPRKHRVIASGIRAKRNELELAGARLIRAHREKRPKFGGALHVEYARLSLVARVIDQRIPVTLMLLASDRLVVQPLAGELLVRECDGGGCGIVDVRRRRCPQRVRNEARLPLKGEPPAEAEAVAHRVGVEDGAMQRLRRPEPGRRRHGARLDRSRPEHLGRLRRALALAEEPLSRRDAPLLDALHVVLVLLHLGRQRATPVGVSPALLVRRMREAASAEAAPLPLGK